MDQKNISELSDESIITIGTAVDKFLVEEGTKHGANGIQLASIVLGRLMVFSHHTNCYNTFQQLMETVCKMKEPEVAEPELSKVDLH